MSTHTVAVPSTVEAPAPVQRWFRDMTAALREPEAPDWMLRLVRTLVSEDAAVPVAAVAAELLWSVLGEEEAGAATYAWLAHAAARWAARVSG